MKVNKKGFTIIEMAVAMAVLSMIVVAMSRIYQQSLVATETGYRLSHGNLVGRTVLQYIVDDLNNCIRWNSSSANSFKKINITDLDSGIFETETISYEMKSSGLIRTAPDSEGTPVKRTVYANPTAKFGNMSVELKNSTFKMVAFPVNTDYPDYVDISFELEIKNLQGETTPDKKRYSSRVYLGDGNINRYNNLGEYADFAP